MKRSLILLSLVVAVVAITACSCSSTTAPAKQPGVRKDLVPVDTSVCRSGYQGSSGRCVEF